ncbi:hypothetical protein ACH4C6_26760 [Streptomyces sp. NPDC017943]|uniref:hypothetical protein n=1 Tax=Streptomyces sp. NPDC017943 TaxID=3365019 RepID=UPI00378DB1EB
MPQPSTQTPNWFERLPRTTRVFIAVSVPVGFACIGLGTWLDYVDWWQDHGYLLNLFSGITGACFGVPFALVGLDYLTRNQVEHRESEKAHARGAAEVDGFVTSLLGLFNGRGLDDVATRSQDLLVQIDVIRRMPLGDPSRDDALRGFLDDFGELVPARNALRRENFRSFTRFSDQIMEVRLWKTAVRRQWNRLDTARSQMPGDWIDKGVETAAHQAVEQLLADGRNPWSVRTADRERSGVPLMRHFLLDLTAMCEAAQAMKAHPQYFGG